MPRNSVSLDSYELLEPIIGTGQHTRHYRVHGKTGIPKGNLHQ
jgi:hypothetical protein